MLSHVVITYLKIEARFFLWLNLNYTISNQKKISNLVNFLLINYKLQNLNKQCNVHALRNLRRNMNLITNIITH